MRSCPSSKEQNTLAPRGSAAYGALQYAAPAGARGTRSLPVFSLGHHRCPGTFSSLTELPVRRTPASKRQHSSSCVLFTCRTNRANPEPGFRQAWDAQGGDKRHRYKGLHHDAGSGSTREASRHPSLLRRLRAAPNHPSPCRWGAGPAAGTRRAAAHGCSSCAFTRTSREEPLVAALSCTSLHVRACIK